MTVYLVDDSSFINLVCRQSLTKAGFTVVGESYDGEDAVLKVSQLQPSVVIMDVALPKKNGLDAAAEILSSHPDIKIIAVSALEEEWVGKRASAAGCSAFLQKPFTAEEFVSLVQKVAGAPEELKYG